MQTRGKYILRNISSTRLIIAILLVFSVMASPVLAGPGVADREAGNATVPAVTTTTGLPVTNLTPAQTPVPVMVTPAPAAVPVVDTLPVTTPARIPEHPVSAGSGANSVTIVVRDARTMENLGDARVYLDGGYRGDTPSSEGAGILSFQDIPTGTHTVRVTRSGYKEITRKFVSPGEPMVVVQLPAGALVSLNTDDSKANAINVIFYPSSTSYSCKDHTKLPAPEYLDNETRFRSDVLNVINKTYLNLDQLTSPLNPLPADYRNDFNFYYYYDPSMPADAFSGCAGSVPEKYWNDVPFSDITVILYPGYYGISADSTCQPTGCYQDFGPGRQLMKAPADQVGLVRHEMGHALFGLVDTYCGATSYYQNYPEPNVWSSAEACRSDARATHRNPDQCRQIETAAGSVSKYCSKNFWQWDPQPDVMVNSYGGKFGDAATRRINYVLSKTGREAA